jgi:hypothetical protein
MHPFARAIRSSLTIAVVIALVAAAPVAAAKPAAAGGGGKPGYPDRLTWNGVQWQIKTSNSAVGPGPNHFRKENAFVDAQDRLHLRIAHVGGRWTAGEIIGPTSHGYGTYTFTLVSDVSNLDPNVVLGLFTWSDKAQQAHREIDIEFAKWGQAASTTNAQYVVQPHDRANHLHRFDQPSVARSTHSFTWTKGRIVWESTDANGGRIATYTYTGSDVPTPGDERVRLNLWLFGGNPPTNGQPVEVIVESFAFTPS